MGKRLTQIATRTGDDGTTGLGDNTRVPKSHPRIAALVRTTFIAIADRMTSTLTARHPTASPFEIELMVSSLIGGVLVVYTTWAERVGVTDTARSRKVWSELFDIHLRFVRDGYLAASRSSH